MVLLALAEIAVETSWWALKQSYNLGYYMMYGETESKEDRILKQIEELRKQNELERIELNEIRNENKMMREIYNKMIESGEIVDKSNVHKTDKYKENNFFKNTSINDDVQLTQHIDEFVDVVDVVDVVDGVNVVEIDDCKEIDDSDDLLVNNNQEPFIYNYYRNILNK
jgi:hypothetical protein